MSERYPEYLESPGWRLRAMVMKDLAQETCEWCGRQAVRPLHVHHVSYRRVGHESPQDLVVLCGPCHKKAHEGTPETPDLGFIAEHHPADFEDYMVWEYRCKGWSYLDSGLLFRHRLRPPEPVRKPPMTDDAL